LGGVLNGEKTGLAYLYSHCSLVYWGSCGLVVDYCVRNILRGLKMYTPLKSYPPVLRHPEIIGELEGFVRGLDLEWDKKTSKLTILGLSDDKKAVSVSYADGRDQLASLARDGRYTFVGHNVIQADGTALTKDGIHVPHTRYNDTIIKFWLNNSHLCKTTSKASLEEEDEKRGRGFMNLGTMLSVYTDLPRHKECQEAYHVEIHKEPTGVLYKTGKRKGQIKYKNVKERIIDHACNGPCPDHKPFDYNGIDTIGPVLALPKLDYQMKIRGLGKLYDLHAELAVLLAKIRERGVPVDLKYVGTLKGEFEEARAVLRRKLVDIMAKKDVSPKAKAWFKENFNIVLPNLQEQTIRDMLECFQDCEPLRDLLEFKELGAGSDRWFGKKYLVPHDDKVGFVHPGMNYFTSSGRLMCAGPNFHNVLKRRIDRKTGEKVGKKMRRAIAAPEGYYIYRADYKNAENRNYLYLAGYKEIPDEDFHTWMQHEMGITEKDPFAIAMGGAREGAKSIVHATDYLEGLKLEPYLSPKVKREVELGIRVAYPDWKFEGKIVTFTGINLARRVFGDASWDNRRAAIRGQQAYFGKFELLRNLYMRITRQVEQEKVVRPPHGYFLQSYGYAEDRLKTAASVWGCLSPDTLVLTADLRWVPNGNLRVGQELVGIEENHRVTRRRRMVPSIVEHIAPVVLPTFRIITDRGEVMASGEHPWLARPLRAHDNHSLRWIRTDQLTANHEIAYLSPPWQDDLSYEAGYLAAGVDGEGSIERRIIFYQAQNEMLETMIDFGRKKGFVFNNDRVQSRDPMWKDSYRLSINGLPECLRFAGSIRPKRLDSHQLWAGIHPFGRYAQKARVLRVESLGPRELVAMSTSTKTFVANGMFTHNSQPIAHYTKIALLNAENRGLNPILQIHDELLFLVNRALNPRVVKGWIVDSMYFDTPEMPGFRIPVDVSRGLNWADQEEIQ